MEASGNSVMKLPVQTDLFGEENFGFTMTLILTVEGKWGKYSGSVGENQICWDLLDKS